MNLQPFLDFAMEAAWRAGRLTLGYFQGAPEVELKADESPVTVADREGERLLRALIERRYPDHAIAGEEFGAADSDAPLRWILDPIDGTRSFVAGVPLYTVLVALVVDGEPRVGVVYAPALDEMVAAADGLGCRWNGRPCGVSTVERLDEATLCYTDPDAFAPHGRGGAWARLGAAARQRRGWGDAYGHLLVATGRAEAMFDPIMNLWDCAPLLPILREAGGTFTDWAGNPRIDGEEAISTNGRLLEPILTLIGEREERAP